MPDNQAEKYLKHQSFQPGFLSLFINPFYLVRRPLFKHIRAMAPSLTGKLLDFGCGRKPYQNLFSVNEYIGVDMEKTGHDHSNSKVDVFYDGKKIPFGDNTFDSLPKPRRERSPSQSAAPWQCSPGRYLCGTACQQAIKIL